MPSSRGGVEKEGRVSGSGSMNSDRGISGSTNCEIVK